MVPEPSERYPVVVVVSDEKVGVIGGEGHAERCVEFTGL
jgi:hypothetical protein